MPLPRTVVICLREELDPAQLHHAAVEAVSQFGLTTAGATACALTQHFLAHQPQPRRRRRPAPPTALLAPHGVTAAGGPVTMLNLGAMRDTAWSAALAYWQVWHQVVAGTPVAKPWWVFYDRHQADPDRNTVARAQLDYRSQPRVQAMAAFNAVPGRWIHLDTASLEALQAGQTTFANLAAAAAVPADLLITDGTLLACRQERLTDQLDYLQAANAALHHPAVAALAALTLQPQPGPRPVTTRP
jgi:hypothetical protein